MFLRLRLWRISKNSFLSLGISNTSKCKGHSIILLCVWYFWPGKKMEFFLLAENQKCLSLLMSLSKIHREQILHFFFRWVQNSKIQRHLALLYVLLENLGSNICSVWFQGSTIVDRCVTISRVENYQLPPEACRRTLVTLNYYPNFVCFRLCLHEMRILLHKSKPICVYVFLVPIEFSITRSKKKLLFLSYVIQILLVC